MIAGRCTDRYVAAIRRLAVSLGSIGLLMVAEVFSHQVISPTAITVEVPIVLAHVALLRGNNPVEQVQSADLELLVDNRPCPISGFGREEWPLSVVLAVDTSGSITQILPRLQRAAKEILTVLQTQDRLALLAFSHQSQTVVPFTDDRELVLKKLAELEAHGGTALNDALFSAAAAFDGEPAGRRRVILFLSDNRAMPANVHSEPEALRKAHEVGAVVLGIHLPSERDDTMKRMLGSMPDSPRIRAALRASGDMYRFAKGTGGEILKLKKNEELGTAFRHMAQRISSLYYLAIQPDSRLSNQTLHSITVRLSPEGSKRWGSVEISHRLFFKY